MFRPVSAVEVSWPVRSSLLPSSNTFSVSICWFSGGCAATLNSGPLFSPGSRIAGCSERSAVVVPPSTASGPRIPSSRCAGFANVFRLPRPGCRLKFGSARSGTTTAFHQSPAEAAGLSGQSASGAVNVATAAHWTTVLTDAVNPPAGLAVLVTCSSFSLQVLHPLVFENDSIL